MVHASAPPPSPTTPEVPRWDCVPAVFTDTFLHTGFEHAEHTLQIEKSSLLEFMVTPDYRQNITVKAPAITTQAHGHNLEWRPQNSANGNSAGASHGGILEPTSSAFL